MVRSGGDQRRNYRPLLPGLVVPLTLLGKLLTAFQNKTPLIVTAGQQTREMLLLEPWLTNVEATTLPRPWVKWAYEPVRAQDVPAAIMRGIAIAVQPPAGPVFLSLPLDDWDQPCAGPAVVRTVATRTAPDPARLREFAEVIRQASHPVLIYGAAIAGERVDRGGRIRRGAQCPGLGRSVFRAGSVSRKSPAVRGRVAVRDRVRSATSYKDTTSRWRSPRCFATTRTWLARVPAVRPAAAAHFRRPRRDWPRAGR